MSLLCYYPFLSSENKNKINSTTMVFDFSIHRYRTSSTAAATASTVVLVLAASKEEEEGAFMVDCCLLFSLLV